MHGTLKGMEFLESMILKHKVCYILYVLNFIFYKIDGSFGIIISVLDLELISN